MRFRLSQEDQKFREESREFLQTQFPKELRDRVASHKELNRDDFVTSQRILNAAGLAVPGWPVEWGGRDWTPLQHHIWREELAANAVLSPLDFNTSMFGPVLATFGSQAQKERFLPATANLDIWWSQGFSEPEAGSDLASLKTTAVLDGDHWVVNGSKTWTTLGQYGDWMFALVRTDPHAPKRQEGISFMIMDMTTPGIIVRPIELIDGSHEVNEVFFEDVRVPVENIIGEVNKGWTYAKFLLSNERDGIGAVGDSKRTLALAKEAASKLGLLQDFEFSRRFVELENELLGVELTALRVAGGAATGEPDPVSSVLKLRGSRLSQEVTELVIDLSGPGGIASGAGDDSSLPEWVRTAVPHFLNERKSTIYGGSDEIQRTIISRTILGM